jgi:hypothetical protein
LANIAVFFLLIVAEVMRFWALCLAVVISVAAYFVSEAWLARGLSGDSVPVVLVVYAIVCFFVSRFGFSLCHTTMKPGLSPVSCYLFATFESALLFIFASSVKLLLVGTGIVRVGSVRRGIFGVFQRVFIAFRNIMMVPIFLGFFLGIPAPTLSDMLHPGSLLSVAYIVIKCLWQAWLLRDFAAALGKFCENTRAQLVDVTAGEATEECVVCLERPTSAVRLACGHVFCRECAHRWLCQRAECPLCRQKIVELKHIDFGDGRTPWSTLLLSF